MCRPGATIGGPDNGLGRDMPSEMRRVIFRSDELVAAISEYNMGSGGKLPFGTVIACKPIDGPEVVVRLDILEQRSGETRTVDLTAEIVGAALLRYCMKHRIPIPRIAEKSIQVHGDTLSLNISIKDKSKGSSGAGTPKEET
jgi:hypothetical protein